MAPETTGFQRDFARELGRALTYLYRSRKKFMAEHLRGYGFSGVMYMILLHTARHPGVSQDGIASHMYLDKCSVARQTKKLEELGYLCRKTNQNDRRQNNLYLTQEGEELVPTIRDYLSQWGQGASKQLTPAEKDLLLSLITKMTGQNN